MAEIITGIVCIAFMLASVILGIVHLLEKGKPFNNSYIFASEQERETMNLKPLFRQSAIVFLFIAVIFLINALGCLMKNNNVFYLLIPAIAGAVIYAIISSVAMNKKK